MTHVISDMRKLDGTVNYPLILTFIVMPVLVITAILITIGFMASEGQSDPASIFITKYAAAGKCLHGTPYDPEHGAFTAILHDPKSSYPILAVIPKDANFESPSVLSFSVFTRGGTPGPDLYANDHLVTSFMYDKCHVDVR